MRIEKRLLTLAWIKTDKVLAGIFAPHAEKLQPHLFARNDCHRRAPIDLGFMPSLRIAWNKGVRSLKPKSYLGESHIPTNRGFSPFEAMLIHQPIVYPMCRMSLLCRLLFVAFQPPVDGRQVIPQCREPLMIPLLVSPRFTAYCFLDRIAGMTG